MHLIIILMPKESLFNFRMFANKLFIKEIFFCKLRGNECWRNSEFFYLGVISFCHPNSHVVEAGLSQKYHFFVSSIRYLSNRGLLICLTALHYLIFIYYYQYLSPSVISLGISFDENIKSNPSFNSGVLMISNCQSQRPKYLRRLRWFGFLY